MIAASSVVSHLGTNVPKPATESQARPLAKLPAEDQAEAAAQEARTAPRAVVGPFRPRVAPAAQPAPPIPAIVRGTPPHSARRWRAPAPFVRRGRTAGGGRRAPRTATEPHSARYARRSSWDAVAASPPMKAAGHPAFAVSPPPPPPNTPHPLHPFRVRISRQGEGEEGTPRRASFGYLESPARKPDEQPPRLIHPFRVRFADRPQGLSERAPRPVKRCAGRMRSPRTESAHPGGAGCPPARMKSGLRP